MAVTGAMEKRRALVIGFGSIGRRHARILDGDGHDVALVTRQQVSDHPRFADLETALRSHHPHYVVVANHTIERRCTLDSLAAAGFQGPVLVEKPLDHQPGPPTDYPFADCRVGYNLRSHPALARFRELLADEPVLSMQVSAGQYLPDWRPGRDYREVYSARSATGGGVLRDLSHELDALLWIAGPWTAVAATGGRLSHLEIDCEDTVAAILALASCPAVTLHLDYLDRQGHRTLRANTDTRTLALDLVRGELMTACDGEPRVETHRVERDETYRRQHRALLEGNAQHLCSLAEGRAVV